MESVEVVFIFEHRGDPFTLPYVKGSISNHPCIAASAGGTKGMVMVHEEGAWAALEDEPRLVGREDGACAMELCYIQGTCLHTWWGNSDLCMYKHMNDI